VTQTAPAKDTLSIGDILAAARELHRAGRLREAHALYCRALSAEPRNADALSRMGLLLHQTGQDAAAIKMLRRALAVRSDFPEAHATLGAALLAQGEAEAALPHLERAVALKPGLVSAHSNLGRAFCAVGRIDKAIAAFERAIVLDPRFVDAHYHMGCALECDGRTEEAIRRYRKALAIAPDHAKAQDALGRALRSRGALDEAEAAFRRALAARPDFADARIHLADLLVEKDALDAAADEYRTVLAERPERAEAHHGLGRIAQRRGRVAEAAERFEKAIALAPDRVACYVDLGRLYRRDGRFDDAITKLLEAVALAPETPAVYVELGAAFFAQGHADQAAEQYEKALSLDGSDADAFHHLAVARLAQGRYNEARAAFHNVMRARHGGRWWNAERFVYVGRNGGGPIRAAKVSTFRLRDHMEQIAHLVERGLLDRSFEAMVERYRQVLAEVEHAAGEDGIVRLTPSQTNRVGGFLDKVVRFHDTPRIDGALIDEEADLEGAEHWLAHKQAPAAVIDGLLAPAAFRALRDFCRDNTIFFRDIGPGTVGADLDSGFNCALVYALAKALKKRMPHLLEGYELAAARAYRDRNRHPGGAPETAAGAVVALLWLSPEAPDSDGGGLVIGEGTGAARIGHGENRAILFRGDAPYRLDACRFADGFVNRRVTATLVFRRPRASLA